MAAGLARRIFGPGHSVSSACAETAEGLPAAKNAVIAMKEIGIDISSHRAAEVDLSTLDGFDTIIFIRPSTAESVPIPRSINIEFFDIPNPYGSDLDE
jgi:protein-tyrosine phosphatase